MRERLSSDFLAVVSLNFDVLTLLAISLQGRQAFEAGIGLAHLAEEMEVS